MDIRKSIEVRGCRQGAEVQIPKERTFMSIYSLPSDMSSGGSLRVRSNAELSPIVRTITSSKMFGIAVDHSVGWIAS